MKKLLFLVLFIFPLVGCVPAAILVAGAAGATLGGAVIYDQRNYQTMKQDYNAYSLAQYQLSNDSLLKGQSHISISVFNNIALLVGEVKTPEMRDYAYQIVSKIPNIRRIYNEININIPTSAIQQANDAWITTKARVLILGTPGLRSSNLKVITQNNVVYLMGIVTPKQAAMVADVARRISGVTKVIKVFEYE
ncbi:BON domain-containing protein [Coxiella endosymbiont of Amblyomma nuttalli]|uniref:BON domain-containing protein n=1 Tax=Coxiella endosymbiont of Amblyomma nuttalli TaxID=2749996 RepID=UPI001BA96071|nr:BON domain-containing protein [Coxiella endosymbiont of Amblyomma nuttalli]QTS84168.1 outer membrane lipoprotein [Coxiella endosymbiont of Amblyomma nuttalli]